MYLCTRRGHGSAPKQTWYHSVLGGETLSWIWGVNPSSWVPKPRSSDRLCYWVEIDRWVVPDAASKVFWFSHFFHSLWNPFFFFFLPTLWFTLNTFCRLPGPTGDQIGEAPPLSIQSPRERGTLDSPGYLVGCSSQNHGGGGECWGSLTIS